MVYVKYWMTKYILDFFLSTCVLAYQNFSLLNYSYAWWKLMLFIYLGHFDLMIQAPFCLTANHFSFAFFYNVFILQPFSVQFWHFIYVCMYVFIYLFLKILFIYSWETMRERQRHRQREKQAPCKEPNVGLDPGTPGSHLSWRQTLNCCVTEVSLFITFHLTFIDDSCLNQLLLITTKFTRWWFSSIHQSSIFINWQTKEYTYLLIIPCVYISMNSWILIFQ